MKFLQVLFVEVDAQQLLVDEITVLSEELTQLCLTQDDQHYLATSTAWHFNEHQELLNKCQVCLSVSMIILKSVMNSCSSPLLPVVDLALTI